MKTAKRNARTATIFNNVMDAITKVYGINEHMTLKDIYETMLEKSKLKFQFLDTNGKIIYNTLGVAKNSLIIGRRLSFVDSDEYIEASINNSEDYKDGLISANQIDNASFEFDTFLFLLTNNIINSRLLTELVGSYIYKYYKNKDYKALIRFETIFGHQFLSRKEFDRIRYIIFRDLSIYDVMNGYMIPGTITCLLRQKYSVIAIAISSETGYDYEKILSNIVFKKIKNMLLSFGRGVSQEEIYDICGSIMLALNPSIKYLIPDYYPIFKEKVEKLFKDRSSFIPKNEFQLKHAILTDDKKIYPAYQERQESNI